MARKIVTTLVACCFITCTLLIACTPESEALTEKQRKKIGEQAQKTLQSKNWALALTLKDAKKGTGQQADVLVFTERTVTSQLLSSLGYSQGGSNYALRVQDDGSAIFETMQRQEENQDAAFLKGTLQNGVLTGVLFVRPAKGATSTFYFTSAAH